MQLKVALSSSLNWLTETWTQKWTTFNEGEMPKFPWQDVKEGIQRLRKIEVLEQIFHVWPKSHKKVQKAVL